MRGICQQYVSFSLISKLSRNINMLTLGIILSVDIYHAFSNSPGLSIAGNNTYFQIVTSKKECGTALAHKKGKTWKH